MKKDSGYQFSAAALSACFLILTGLAYAQVPEFSLEVKRPTGFTVSPPLIGIPDTLEPGAGPRQVLPLPRKAGNNAVQADSALQSTPGPLIAATAGTHFDGVGANGSAPPDTNVAVGPNHIFQVVNTRYAIYDKSGNILKGPSSLSSIWSTLGGNCATRNAGDPVVQYDLVADRWLVTQLGSLSSPYSQCIAVSQTSDPTGSYNLYSYNYGSTLNDYDKFGVWPTATNSAYTATNNLFVFGAFFTGGQLCAYDRSAMLSGAANPAGICFNISGDGGYLPVDLDGPMAPLSGTPAYFINFETTSSLRVYKLAPNFANPSSSTLTRVTPDITVNAFSEACGGGTCIPQSGTTNQLDSLADRLMYRLAFRRFSDHESIVVNHSVTAGSSAGVRWYELQSPVSTTGNFSLFQQGTFAPDSNYRWMGSAAMDQAGDIALGYSVSSSSMHPAIRYTGRVPSDPAGSMQSEASLVEGAGSQTGGLTRWGDYSAMRIDPKDDCTFWYSTEYLSADGSFNWKTHIGSFKFTACGTAATPDFSISANPTAITAPQAGAQATSTITVTSLNGFNSAVGLSISGCPLNATCTLDSASLTPPSNGSVGTTLRVNAATTTPVGTYTLTIMGTGPSTSHSTTVTLNVVMPDFSISASPSSLTVTQGGSQGTSTITVTSLNGFSSAVSLSVSGCPAAATCTLDASSLTPPANGSGSTTLRVNAGATTPTGTYSLMVTGTSGSLSHSTTITLTVNSSSPDFTISASPSSLSVARGSRGTSTITVTAVGGSSSVTLSASGNPANTAVIFSVNPVTATGTSVMTVGVSTAAAVGTFTITVRGTNGTFTHTTPVTLTIN